MAFFHVVALAQNRPGKPLPFFGYPFPKCNFEAAVTLSGFRPLTRLNDNLLC